jgi:hypothetical protein
MTNRHSSRPTEPASPDRAADVAAADGREDDRNDVIDQSPVPDPAAEDADAGDDPQAD